MTLSKSTRRLQGCLGALFVYCAASSLRPDAASASVAESAEPPSCFGDCNGDGTVTIDEVVLLVSSALGNTVQRGCPLLPNRPHIAEIGGAVNSLLFGCPNTITYELADESQIAISQRSGEQLVIVHEPLTGTFTLVPVEPPPVKNTLFYYYISQLDFRGATANVHAVYGNLSASTLELEYVAASIVTTINGTGAQLFGSGPAAAFPAMVQLELCGVPDPQHGASCETIREGQEEGYIITIEAVPVSAK